ncbi:MAG: hypothetical protein JKY56_03775, partial [Kofleriaceae bacterium]|nr:hypothetical protein [Kofleriaceae bacterium]
IAAKAQNAWPSLTLGLFALVTLSTACSLLFESGSQSVDGGRDLDAKNAIDARALFDARAPDASEGSPDSMVVGPVDAAGSPHVLTVTLDGPNVMGPHTVMIPSGQACTLMPSCVFAFDTPSEVKATFDTAISNSSITGLCSIRNVLGDATSITMSIEGQCTLTVAF